MSSKIDFTTLPGNYSTSEIDTGFTWVDGKTIYKKTINFGALPNATGKSVPHNISNLDFFIKIEGITQNPTDRVFYQLPKVMISGSSYQAQLQVGNINVRIDTSQNLSSYTETYVTLYYTKSS